MSFDEAVKLLERDERFKATVSAMNTLLVQKGIYTQEEFEAYFCQWAEARVRASVTATVRPPRARSAVSGGASLG